MYEKKTLTEKKLFFIQIGSNFKIKHYLQYFGLNILILGRFTPMSNVLCLYPMITG